MLRLRLGLLKLGEIRGLDSWWWGRMGGFDVGQDLLLLVETNILALGGGDGVVGGSLCPVKALVVHEELVPVCLEFRLCSVELELG